MIKYYKYIIYIISLFLSKLFIYKKVGIYNLFIKLSFGNFKYSIYGVKLSNKDKKIIWMLHRRCLWNNCWISQVL